MRTLISALLLAAVAVFPAVANATCSQTGHVARVTMWDDAINGSHVVYLKNSATTTITYLCSTRDDNFANQAGNALTSGVRVVMNGAIASCPTTGTFRNIGQCRWIVVQP